MDQGPKGNTGNCFPEMKAFPRVVELVEYTGLFHPGLGSNFVWFFFGWVWAPC